MPQTDSPRHVPAHWFARLKGGAQAKPRIALMGEFSSGKSSLLNLLIGEELLPTKVTATELPPVWFSHGAPRAWWVDRNGRRHEIRFGDFAAVPPAARYVRVFAPSAMLERCDIIDTPGISDPNLGEDTWRFAVGQANFILWCTSATQAWRETERSTWASLPERLRANSVMVVTRADKLGDGDREKVKRRLSRETFGLFGGLVLLSTPEAVRGQSLLTANGQDDVWVASGGADLDARIEAGLESVRAARLDLLERYATADTGPLRQRQMSDPWDAADADDQPDAALLVLDPVRPRRVEFFGSPRTERPAGEDASPLGAMRTDWASLRESGARPGLAPVLRLADPVRPAPPSSWIEDEDEDDQPLLLDHAWAAAAPARREDPAPLGRAVLSAEATPARDAGDAEEGPPLADLSAFAQPEPDPFDLSAFGQDEPEQQPAPNEPDSEETDHALSLEALLAAATEQEPEHAPTELDPDGTDLSLALDALLAAAPDHAPTPLEPSAEALPRAVRLWRDIVAQSAEIPSNGPIIAMIDQLLCELSRDDGLSDKAGPTAEMSLGQTRAA